MYTIYWPAIIKQQHSEELIYLASDRDWLEFCCLQPHIDGSQDKLLDSAGVTFDIVIQPLQKFNSTPSSATADLPQLIISQRPIDLVSFIHYVREHAVLNGHCCSAKLVFSDIKQGIETVAYLESN
ncbi:DUF4144 family protein [Shewanella goraebulensis]|uniref:DUF4144 family protein n=1 Tax=Shewanella goraebulensis TaxID=3050637 RepID=UPI00254DFC96|nr:DUF4144 family protein [Shewanella goraebulensis]